MKKPTLLWHGTGAADWASQSCLCPESTSSTAILAIGIRKGYQG